MNILKPQNNHIEKLKNENIINIQETEKITCCSFLILPISDSSMFMVSIIFDKLGASSIRGVETPIGEFF